MSAAVRVELPRYLCALAGLPRELTIPVDEPVTVRSILDSLEAAYPALQGTIREHGTEQRRAFMRFFVCQEDWSHRSSDEVLPEVVATGDEPFLVIGAIAGG